MKTLKEYPNIAVLFGVLAIVTSVILIVDVPKMVNYIFAILWLITGLLGFYAAAKR